MPGIRSRDNESVDRLLKQFKKQIEKAGVMSEVKKRQHYEKPSIRKKRKEVAARKRLAKTVRKMNDIGY
ncbi:MAG: 30S ribosomal protein S21 [Oligoflexales bacterium]|nr:30S ribosomal protein S21 [Oligoflexales bacterium]